LLCAAIIYLTGGAIAQNTECDINNPAFKRCAMTGCTIRTIDQDWGQFPEAWRREMVRRFKDASALHETDSIKYCGASQIKPVDDNRIRRRRGRGTGPGRINETMARMEWHFCRLFVESKYIAALKLDKSQTAIDDASAILTRVCNVDAEGHSNSVFRGDGKFERVTVSEGKTEAYYCLKNAEGKCLWQRRQARVRLACSISQKQIAKIVPEIAKVRCLAFASERDLKK